MRIVQSLPREEWSRFVDEHPYGNVFHTPEMFDVFERAHGCAPEIWGAVDGDRILALLLPVSIVWLSQISSPFTTQTVAYGGVINVNDSHGEAALNELLQTYRGNIDWRVTYTELRNLHDQSKVMPILNANGFKYEEHLNFLIDTSRRPRAIMQDIGSRTRKNVRRALRANQVQVSEACKWEEVQQCYRLIEKSYKSAQVPIVDISLFRAAFELLLPRHMVRFTLARVEGAPAASSVELLHKDVVYGWYGGLDRKYGSYMPNEVLTWKILEWASENGYSTYDFGGAGKPDEEYGVRDFKAKFGGELVCLGRNRCVHAPIRLRLAKSGYRLLRRLVSIPQPLQDRKSRSVRM